MRTGSRAFVDNDVCTTYCRLSFCRPGAMRLGEEFRVFGFSAPNPHLIEFSDVPERLEMGFCVDAAVSLGNRRSRMSVDVRLG